jgi:hypothetical protein
MPGRLGPRRIRTFSPVFALITSGNVGAISTRLLGRDEIANNREIGDCVPSPVLFPVRG